MTKYAALLAFALAAGAAACSGGQAPCRPVQGLAFSAPPKHAYAQVPPVATDRLGIVADVQRTSYEGCMGKNEVNDDEQRILLADLARRGPSATLLLGDLVFRGDSALHWSYFDHLMLESGLARGSLFALPGNHDYMFKRDLHELTDRFPRLRRATHDAIDWGGLRLLLLDANRHELGESAWQRQLHWLDCELAAVARGCARGVLLFSHQSPFTQSPWAPDNDDLKSDMVPRFCANPRHVAYISAHAHGYERWTDVRVPGCCQVHTPFIVTAGGGGPRPPHRRDRAPHDSVDIDAWPDGHGFSDWPRPFNYLILTQSDAVLRIDVYALEKGEGFVTLGETVEVPLAVAPQVVPAATACECPL